MELLIKIVIYVLVWHLAIEPLVRDYEMRLQKQCEQRLQAKLRSQARRK